MSAFMRFIRLLFVSSKNVVMNKYQFIFVTKNNIRKSYNLERLHNCLIYFKLKNNKSYIGYVKFSVSKDVVTNMSKTCYVLREHITSKIYDFEDVIKFKPLDYSWSKVLK